MNAFPIRRKIFSLIAVLWALTVYTAAPFAAEQATRPEKEEIKTEAISENGEVQNTESTFYEPLPPTIEGAGSYEKPADGSLGHDFWQGTPRSAAVQLLKNMPASSHSPALQKLIFGTLLSKTDGSLLENDVPQQPGMDLLTLRLEKLIEAGAYRQALDLYSKLGLENPPQSVARAGILSMLFSGEKTLACLELNTVLELYGNEEFFKAVGAYCDVSMSENPSADATDILKNAPDKLLLSLATQKDFSVTYTPAFFDKYSVLEKAFLTAENRLTLSPQTDRMFKDAPSSHIQILLKNPALSEKDKFVLNVRALEWGVVRADEFRKTLLSAIDLDVRKDPALAPPANAEDWQKLPYFLQIATNKSDNADKWANIRQALPAGRTYGPAVLIPFAEVIYKVKPVSPTFDELYASVETLILGGYRIPDQWAEIIENFNPAEAQKDAYTALLAASFLSEADNRTQKAWQKLETLVNSNKSAHSFFVNNIIENVDKASQGDHTAKRIYDNNIDLTFQQDYVMPSMKVWNRLLEASKEGHVGETVLLSAMALRGAPLREAHPELFLDVIASLKSVGLTDISDGLAMEAALGKSDDD